MNSNKIVYIDDENYQLKKYNWYLNKDGYVFRYQDNKIQFLHREIMHAQKNQIVDHIDGNPLNNQKVNLRICSIKENSYNKQLYKNNTSGYNN